MARAAGVLFGLVLLGGVHCALSDCDDVIDCHIGKDVNDLKTWLNTKLHCDCDTNPHCSCIGKCNSDICTDMRMITLFRAYDAIADAGCDAGLQELIRVQRDKCIDPQCCFSCPELLFTESYRQCAVPFSNAETIFSSVYLGLAVFIFLFKSSTTSSVALVDALFPKAKSAAGYFLTQYVKVPTRDPYEEYPPPRESPALNRRYRGLVL